MGQNMQNFCRFYTTFDFDREYLWIGSRYSTIGKLDDRQHFLLHYTKRSGEFRSTNYRYLRPENFTRATDWPSLASAHPKWNEDPPPKVNRENLKFGIKFCVLELI